MIEFTARSQPGSGFAMTVAELPERPTSRYDSVGCTTRGLSSGPRTGGGGAIGVEGGMQDIYGSIMDAADG